MSRNASSREGGAVASAQLDHTLLTPELSRDDVALLRRAFGINGELTTLPQRQADRGAFLTVLEVAVGMAFADFFRGFAQEAGQEAFNSVIALLRRRQPPGCADANVHGVLLMDTRGVGLAISLYLEPAAVSALGGIDWGAVRDDWISWDRTEKVWRGDASGVLPRRRAQAASDADVDERRPLPQRPS
jgi:hypothetical protein